MCAGLSGAVFHTPCNNQCGDFLKLMEDEKRIRRQGLLLQKQYLIAAENLPPHHLRVAANILCVCVCCACAGLVCKIKSRCCDTLWSLICLSVKLSARNTTHSPPSHRHSVGTYQGNELTHNSSGNTRPQSFKLTEPLWTNPCIKSV